MANHAWSSRTVETGSVAEPISIRTPRSEPPLRPAAEVAEPMRGDIYTPERLEQLASTLGATHAFTGKRVRGPGLLERLVENRKTLLASYQSTVEAVQQRRWISPAADWLINNFHVIQEHLREAREDLPASYYRDLPKLVGGSQSGLPRVYGLAVELITHTDGKLEIETLERFVRAYQAVAPLGMGELWAIPIALRVALIENLARIAVKVDRARDERNAASVLAAELIRVAAMGAHEVRAILRQRVAGRGDPSTTMFVTELLLRLRDQDPAMEHALEWLETRLSEQGITVDAAVRLEHQSQAQNQVSIGNAITSMRLITATDWSGFFERVSVVDAILREDPSADYPRMDFASRDRYRHVIERIARRTGIDEVTVARGAIQLARDGKAGADPRRAHVGYHLVAGGLGDFKAATGYRPSWAERASALLLAHPGPIYLGGLAAMTAALVGALVVVLHHFGVSPLRSSLVAVLAAFPASELCLNLLNLAVTAMIPPAPLPKLDFRQGIPEDARTLVAVPTMLTSLAGVDEMLEALEVRYLANQDPNLYFALLSDWLDHDDAKAPGDDELVAAARRGIEELNRRYGQPRFFLLHRSRVFSRSEGRYIGWERKRGKLVELNRLILGQGATTFSEIVGDSSALGKVRFVLTLDGDTRLPPSTAARLVGTIAHPLNFPQVDGATRTIRVGHGVIQPRVSVSLESATRSPFARIFSAQAGVDPYTTVVSDVYQDLFDEGSFVGKGIYEVRAFEAVLDGRLPADTILSHDLLEGSYARSALAADIELFDDTPAHYLTHAMRRHRWTRGDWQIVSWLFPGLGRERNVLGYLSRWKIGDNLRRTLVAPSLAALLLFAWLGHIGSPAFWTFAIVAAVAFPAYARLTTSAISAPRGVTLPSYFGNLGRETARNGAQALLTLGFLPHQAWISVDGAVRALVRRFVTHKKLLEWLPASVAEGSASLTVASHYRRMWVSPALALATAALLAARPSGAWPAAAPFLVAWMLAPLVAARVSRPEVDETPRLAPDDVRFLRVAARRTWRFFETFVTAADHHLPPDNFQESPAPVLARRTSPTNIGLLLLADVVSVDRGYATLSEGVAAVGKTLDSIAKLERYRGHFLNWYDTSTLANLHPRYISTVDSGNLAGHLWTLKQALLQAPGRPLLGRHVIDGVVDTLLALDDEIARVPAVPASALTLPLRSIQTAVAAMLGELERAGSPELVEWPSAIRSMVVSADRIVQQVERARGGLTYVDVLEEVHYFATALVRQLAAREAEVDALAPWLPFVKGMPDGAERQAVLTFLSSRTSATVDDLAGWSGEIIEMRGRLAGAATTALEALEGLRTKLFDRARRVDAFVTEMDFGFLFDHERKLFSIGFNVAEGRLDPSFYDLLASESRLASFVAIAKADVPVAHWYRLGRPLAQMNQGRVLLSWTGTMFEYLMPCLVMRNYRGTLLDSTYRAMIARQIEYGHQCGVPWGTSEAAYNARDLQLNYQYSPFGVPGLGIKRGLEKDVVVAPYATALALPFLPRQAVQNLRRLAQNGAAGRYGFYESIDYTRARLPDGQLGAVVRAFMAHHQGMTLLALAEYLADGPMRERFHADRRVQATQLLLQERMPYHVPLAELTQQETQVLRPATQLAPNRYRIAFDAAAPPQAHLLSNGSYSVVITASGAGSSRCNGVQVTRWREDATRDHWGQYCYIRDRASGRAWSATHQPTLTRPDAYQVDFYLDKAEFRREENGITSVAVVSVTAEDDAEIRSIKLINGGSSPRELDITTYAEIVLATAAADTAHPAFGNLFVETEFVPEAGALLATRRKRSPAEPSRWAVHVSALEEGGATEQAPLEYETDRARFLGRGRGTDAPAAIFGDAPLSGSVGAVLDPIFSLRRRLRLEAGETALISFTTALADSRDEALRLAEKYRGAGAAQRASALAWTNAQAQLHYLNIDGEATRAFSMLASRLIFANRDFRASPELLAESKGSQSSLWKYGISGDLSVLAVCVSEEAHIELVRQLLHAHEYWRLRGFEVDLVVVNDHGASYQQSFQDHLLSVIRSSLAHDRLDKPGGIFVVRSDLMPPQDRALVLTVARVVLTGARGTILEQIEQQPTPPPLPPPIAPRRARGLPPPGVSTRAPNRKSEFFNGLGGFAESGAEYQIALAAGQWTPAPWSNVIANARFGTLITESGGGYTWCENCRENRLTPWSNDPVSDPPSEVIYIRDEATGQYHTPTPLPTGSAEPYSVRHGQGYSIFESGAQDIEQHLAVFVPKDDPIKLSKLTLHNRGRAECRLTVTYYVEWVLGVQRESAAPFVVTSMAADGSFLAAQNAYSSEFAGRVAFIAANLAVRSFTADRGEFIGGGGNVGRPAALSRRGLSGRLGAGYDPCGAIQVEVMLRPGEQKVLIFLLGEGNDLQEAHALVARYRSEPAVSAALDEVLRRWDDLCGQIEVRTPDTPFDLLVNRWLVYQTLSSRILARTGFYQSGGAYGFRDQLQDAAALVPIAPELAREHILRSASRQFVEGDVQHWWHPPAGRGVRTHISDDHLWLPYVVAHYLEVTGRDDILDEIVPFLQAPELAPGQQDDYLLPGAAAESASLYEHCARAIERSLAVGAHGLPLIGGGDWNDGMNRVGGEGRGESVWLGWFLIDTLRKFAKISEARADVERAGRYLDHAARLALALETQAWDGAWYKRAFFDDGSPLGSQQNDECKIDSLPQTWSVISGAARPERQAEAMASVEQHLVRSAEEMVLLFTPPFDKSPADPGYIKGYLPGVRENGGQYTHAAVWVVLAYALLGDGDRAGEIFSMLNPINRTASRADAERYKVEPYVVAADVYDAAPHQGRGGWTWYTGSAGWMYRVAVEAILGLRLRAGHLVIEPCIPSTWHELDMTYRHAGTTYRIHVENPHGVCTGVGKVEVDGLENAGTKVALVDDGAEHAIRVVLGAR